MNKVQPIATLLFYLSRLASVVYTIAGVYAGIIIILFRLTSISNLPINVSQSGRLEIYYPFTRIPFLLGDNSKYFYIILSLIPIFYGIFLWLLSNVFNAFRQQKLFTKKAVEHLKRFYIVNLSFPAAILLILFLLNEDVKDLIMLTILHVVLGVFAFFIASIFKQGLLLQEEQDLTL